MSSINTRERIIFKIFLKVGKVYGSFDLIRHQEGHHAFFHCAVHNLGNSTVGLVKG